ncbi:hypothetical protein Golax_004675 [Gossypium laxum]|uniref:Uncharacterized protein n=1 Tax=Gossypium laxum TaxID=34288 RepID=A0A7J9AY55_9ROSI|nr:hypothetical protein [Gossypium laxum]
MSCFTFGKVDLVPTIEEYMTLLRCSRIQVDRIYSKAVNVPTFLRKLMNITGMIYMVWLFSLRLWDMWTRRSVTYLIGLIRELHQSC